MVPTQRLRTLFPGLWLAGMMLAAGTATAAAEFDGDDWRIVTPEELAMKGEPRAPGAAAVYLYIQVDRNDDASEERVHHQVKILTEEGRNRASVEIQYDKSEGSVRGIEARVIQPDGSIVPFNGTVYDRPIAKGRDVKLQAKAFTLPDVRVGSVIEYRYVRRQRADLIYDSNWVLSQDLFVRFARYSLVLYEYANARWSWPNGLPPGTEAPVRKGASVRLETHNVPAFVTEQYMPPVNQMQYRVEFEYRGPDDVMETDPAKFWKKTGKRVYRSIENFADNSGAIRDKLAGIVAPGDSAEQKVRKIYRHVQQLRNTSYEPELDEKEARRSKDRDASSASDVAKRGYGSAWELLSYFLTMVRAAGVPAEPVLVGTRAVRFFGISNMNPNHLGRLVAVNLGGRDVLLDPGTPSLPFGELDWSDTAVQALKLDSDGGAWFTTPLPKPADAATLRTAKLALNEDGELEGLVRISYVGREALWRRLRERNEDEQSRREFLESDLKEQLAGPAEIKLVGQPDWAGDTSLQVEYRVKWPQWAVVSGNRMLVGIGLFGGGEKGVFITPNRVHPVYYHYPFETQDDLEITAPAGYRPQAVEARSAAKDDRLVYSTSVETRDGTFVIHRKFSVSALLANRDTYPKFLGFYESVRAGDEQQVVLVH